MALGHGLAVSPAILDMEPGEGRFAVAPSDPRPLLPTRDLGAPHLEPVCGEP